MQIQWLYEDPKPRPESQDKLVYLAALGAGCLVKAAPTVSTLGLGPEPSRGLILPRRFKSREFALTNSFPVILPYLPF